ncbi:hypothetical protein EWU23_00190 [Cytophagaceae bacterium 50C-KIRBA]|uniref:DUF4843 domain-containing protein n=1 Tax=Aquirufa beregesia TaxID=2516556 RepID=A0ABX0EU65_9BACT|nr:hypothetical protein [Aquirufa beregesia]NGZ42888.1 hypothetical protein [Aquirufa beregesia]
MRYVLLFLMGIPFFSCRKEAIPVKSEVPIQKVLVKDKQVQFHWTQMAAKNIQENITQADELLLVYSVVAIEKQQVVQIQQSSHYLGKVKQGLLINLKEIPPLTIKLKPGQSLGVQVTLWEVDDYQKIQQVLKQVNQWGGVLQVPVSILELSSLTNPLGWFMWGMRASGLGMDLWSKWDGNDRLGISEMQINGDKLGSFKKNGTWKSGPKMLNDYHYDFSYEISVRD